MLVPAKIRKLLDRDDPRQIQWRALAGAVVNVLSVLAHQFLFCASSSNDGSNNSSDSSSSDETMTIWNTISIRSMIFGFDARIVGAVLFHTMTLYIGVFLQNLLLLFVILKQSNSFSIKGYCSLFYAVHIEPVASLLLHQRESQQATKWIYYRNLIAAPYAEEVVFRGCLVPALASTGLGALKVSFIAPLFFGLAHAHHAYLKFQRGEMHLKFIILQTVFQFLYTSLFGAYVSYAFLRTGSVLAVAASHSFCNLLGLPDFSFFRSASKLYPFRYILLILHMFAILGFIRGFRAPRAASGERHGSCSHTIKMVCSIGCNTGYYKYVVPGSFVF